MRCKSIYVECVDIQTRTCGTWIWIWLWLLIWLGSGKETKGRGMEFRIKLRDIMDIKKRQDAAKRGN